MLVSRCTTGLSTAFTLFLLCTVFIKCVLFPQVQTPPLLFPVWTKLNIVKLNIKWYKLYKEVRLLPPPPPPPPAPASGLPLTCACRHWSVEANHAARRNTRARALDEIIFRFCEFTKLCNVFPLTFFFCTKPATLLYNKLIQLLPKWQHVFHSSVFRIWDSLSASFELSEQNGVCCEIIVTLVIDCWLTDWLTDYNANTVLFLSTQSDNLNSLTSVTRCASKLWGLLFSVAL